MSCYRHFNLAMGRSPSFASAVPDYSPCSDSLSLRLRAFTHLTLPATATRRVIMQKARRQHTKCLRPLVSVWFQGLFTPLFGVLFTFPSQYWFTIGLSGVFSLGGWCRRVQRGFLRSPPTQDPATSQTLAPTGLSPGIADLPRSFGFVFVSKRQSYNPGRAVTRPVWASARSLATTCAITLVFSSSGYLDVSVPRVRLRCRIP